MTKNVSVLARRREKEDLSILEALIIKRLNPTTNRHSDDFGEHSKCSDEFICYSSPESTFYFLNVVKFYILYVTVSKIPIFKQ